MSDKTLNDVQIEFANGVASFGNMLPHATSDYQTQAGVFADLPITFSTADQSYTTATTTDDAEPLPEGTYSYAIHIVNGELQTVMLDDANPHFDEALAGYWLWQEAQLASGETIPAASDGDEPTGMLLTKSQSLNEGLEGQLFGAYSGCSPAGGAFFTTPNSELVMHMVEFGAEACGDDIVSAEALLLQVISGISTYTLDNDTLTITLPAGDTLRFNR